MYNTDNIIHIMENYLKRLKEMPYEEAVEYSRKSLIESGILDKDGVPHDIVTESYLIN